MRKPVTMTMHILGQVGFDSFARWICHRAQLLDLKGWVRINSAEEVEVVVSGDAVLVDAMEVACHLGPADVLVDRIDLRVTKGVELRNAFVHARCPETAEHSGGSTGLSARVGKKTF